TAGASARQLAGYISESQNLGSTPLRQQRYTCDRRNQSLNGDHNKGCLSMTAIIEIRNLKKRYPPAPDSKDKQGNLAVKGINLTIERGEIYSLLGPNGAGKTTTISMMSGLLTPTEGDVLIDGHSIVKEPLICKKLIGVVPQEIA